MHDGIELGSTLVQAGFWTRTKRKPRLTVHLPFKLVKDDTLSVNHVLLPLSWKSLRIGTFLFEAMARH